MKINQVSCINCNKSWLCFSTGTLTQNALSVTSSFMGCIQDMTINDKLISFSRLSAVFGPVNLKECPGWAMRTSSEQTWGPCLPPPMCNLLPWQRMFLSECESDFGLKCVNECEPGETSSGLLLLSLRHFFIYFVIKSCHISGICFL